MKEEFVHICNSIRPDFEIKKVIFTNTNLTDILAELKKGIYL